MLGLVLSPSMRRALYSPWIRVASAYTLTAPLIVGVWFSIAWASLPRENPSMAVHYNVYTGIDAFASWTWAFLYPIAWLLLSVLDVAFALRYAQEERGLSRAALWIGCVWSIPWIVFLWHLVHINSL